MGTEVGTGSATRRDAQAAGAEATRGALEALQGRPADLLLVFACVGYDQEALLRGVREAAPDTPLSGCSAEGIITQNGSNESAHAVSVLAVASDRIRFKTLAVRGLSAGSAACGQALAAQVENADPQGQLLLLFPDGLTANATQLLGALEQRVPGLKIVGGGAGELMRFEKTYQYHDGTVLNDAVAAVLLSGDFRSELAVSHGCEPVGLRRTVTRARGNQVYEIDGRPAWEAFSEYLDAPSDHPRSANVVQLCVGELLDDPGTPAKLVLRSPLRLDEATGALQFSAELKEGTRIRFTRRDPDQILSSTVASARKLHAKGTSAAPLLVLQFDCCRRGRLLFGEQAPQLVGASAQKELGKQVPWMGMHAYGEIAPLHGRTHFHDYTSVLCALY